MAVLDNIKAIIQPLLNDENSADVIEQLAKLDIDEGTSQEDIDKAIAERDTYWNERFRNTFFEGVTEDADVLEESPAEDDQLVGNEEGNLTFEELFEEEE